jgi:uncharacterized protein
MTIDPARAPEHEDLPTRVRSGRSPGRRRHAVAAAGAALVLAGVVGTAGCAASAQQPAPTINVAAPGPSGTGQANGVTVEGTGEVEGKPDTLTITFGVSVKRDTVDVAVKDNAAVAASMLQALIEQGVEEKDVQTRNYSVQPSFTYAEGRSIPDGYQVDNSVTVQLRNLDGAGASIDAVTAAGGDAVQIQGVSFSLEDDSETVKAARDRAFADARGKAEQFAALSGRSLGEVEAVAEVSRTTPDRYADAAAGAFATDSTPISPGEVTTSVSITVRYTLA